MDEKDRIKYPLLFRCSLKLILLIILCFFPLQLKASNNLALGKLCISSPKPNYPFTAPPTNMYVLTDGKYTRENFNKNLTTVGWQSAKTVEIQIDLKKISTIDSITLSAARDILQSISYPSHVLAYVGSDKEHFLFVGDIAKDPGNTPGPYQTKKFTLSDVGVKGRYVLLLVLSKGPYMFCDEIEVLEGSQDKGKVGKLTLNEARSYSDLIRRLDNEKKLLTALSEKLKSKADSRPELNRRIVSTGQKIEKISSIDDAEAIETDILDHRRKNLNSRFPDRKYLIEEINPWTKLNPIISPTGKPLKRISLFMPKEGFDHAGLLITNLSLKTRQVFLSLDKFRQGAPSINFYQVPFVKSDAIEYVADPLVPLKESFKLRPGESRMVFVSASGKNLGTRQNLLKIRIGDAVTSVPITSQVAAVCLPEKKFLNTNTWGNLDYKSIQGRKSEAVKDLFDHHTNVVVVFPKYLPLVDSKNTPDFSQLMSFLSNYKGASKVLIYMDYRNFNRSTNYGRYKFMDEEWKKGFLKWYEGVLQTTIKAGFAPQSIYLYPFDEMHGDDIDRFIVLAEWAKKETQHIRFFATLNNIQSLQALPYLDIAQIVDRDYMHARVKPGKSELWLYDANGPAKYNSSYSYYRMMSWKAFFLGFKGVGFWAYADARTDENDDGMNDFNNKSTNYSVIYPGVGNSIISSRRWEGWRMGVEDYELLTMFAKQKGLDAAKALAKTVLDNPSDVSKADEVRRKVLLELSK